jgi:hypothetical protein
MSKKETLSNELLQVVREVKKEKDGIVTLNSGVRAKFKPVSPSLIAEVMNRVKQPIPPKFKNPENGIEEDNILDPTYIAALGDVDRLRSDMATNAMIMFGVELLDGIPDDKMWIKKLKYLSIEVDESDELAIEFAYKKYVALSVDDLVSLTKMSSITKEAIDKETASFQRPA